MVKQHSIKARLGLGDHDYGDDFSDDFSDWGDPRLGSPGSGLGAMGRHSFSTSDLSSPSLVHGRSASASVDSNDPSRLNGTTRSQDSADGSTDGGMFSMEPASDGGRRSSRSSDEDG